MTRPRITDGQRRQRLLRRHRLATGFRAADPLAVATAMVGLHSTTPSTPYLSAWARSTGFTVACMDNALYAERSLIKHLAMRRTVFVLPGDVVRDAVGAIGARVAASERTNLLRDLRRSADFADPEAWITQACAQVNALMVDKVSLTSRQIRAELPHLDRSVLVSPDKPYGGLGPVIPRILSMMSAAGQIVRGPNESRWHVSRPRWTAMADWLGGELDPPEPSIGHVAMVRRWLASFGPGTETDLVWWLGSTKTAVRATLRELQAVEVDLDGASIGYVLPDDVPGDGSGGDDGTGADIEPEAHLLPELDSTVMGYKERGFYLGSHRAHLFDRNGNGGQSVWWDGRVVGGWFRDPGSRIEVCLFEEVPGHARIAITRRADELTEWLADVSFRPAFPPPFVTQARSQR